MTVLAPDRPGLDEHRAASPAAALAVREAGSGERLRTHRAVSMLGALGLLWPLFNAWQDVISVPTGGLAAVALLGGALVLACLIATAPDIAALERLDRWLLVLGGLTLIAWTAQTLNGAAGFSTDEAAFTQAATKLMLHGHDPYGANLAQSLIGYGVPQRFWTYTLSGGFVTAYGYPALPLLLTAPFMWLTGDGQAVAYASVAALLATMLIAARLLPRDLRPIAVIACVAFPSLAGFATAGLTIVLMLPFLLVVAGRWTAVGSRGALSRSDAGCAVALGLALSTNQLAWLIAPFVLTGIFALRRVEFGTRRASALALGYCAVALTAFLVVNLPFFVWNPAAWLQGAAAPLTQHALPYGQGLVGLSSFLRLGGGALDAYAVAGALLLLGLLVVFALDVRRFAGCCLLFPLLALFVSGRSLGEYWMALVPVVIVSLWARTDEGRETGGAPDRWQRLSARRRTLARGSLLAPAAAALAVALGSPAPLQIEITGLRSDPTHTVVTRLAVDVHNRSDTALMPHFSTDVEGQASAFWSVVTGPRSIPARSSRHLVLAAPLSESILHEGATFLLQAVSDGPPSVSTSERLVPSSSAVSGR